MKLVMHPPVEPERLARIVEAARPMNVVNARDEAEARLAIADADAFFGKLTPTLLAAARRLRWVQAPTASLEHFVFPELVDHPAVLTNMRGLFSDVIADHVFGYVLCFARNFHHYIRNQVEARWAPVSVRRRPKAVSGTSLRHRPCSGQPCGSSSPAPGGHDARRRRPGPDRRGGRTARPRVRDAGARGGPGPAGAATGIAALWRLDRLPDLLRESDFVVIAAPHTPETVKLFRRAQFRQMKPTGYLINIGRGAIVDLADLTDALRAGEIAGAGLDVFETEPLPKDHPLWAMENVIITPHVAGNSPRIAERHLAVLLDNVGRFARGEPLTNVADKRRWF